MNEDKTLNSYTMEEEKDDSDGDIYGIFKDVVPRRDKKLKWNSTVSVVYVPQAIEYHKAGIGEDIWYNDKDLDKFNKTFRNEILVISHLNQMKINNEKDLTKVKKIWYENLRLKAF